MSAESTDENGWHLGPLEPWLPGQCHAVLAPERSAEFAIARWDHQARRFFDAGLSLVGTKRYTNGWPTVDAGALLLRHPAESDSAFLTSIEVRTVPLERAPAVRVAARAGVEAMGGAGFDALLARTTRVWQFRSLDPTAELLTSAIVASVALGPILAPDGAVFGVKTARERLSRALRP